MENRISVVSIIVEQLESTAVINSLLHEYGQYIVGRMGIPYREKGVSIICVVIDAPNDVTSSLSIAHGSNRFKEFLENNRFKGI